jgi:hypothetical protein
MVKVVSETGTVVVVVPPDGVRTWETVGDEATGREAVPPWEVTYETELGTPEVTYEALTSGDGLTNSLLATEETTTPDSVTTGAAVFGT